MITHETSLKSEQTPQNQLDLEFDSLETEFSGHDRLLMTRQIMEEIFRPDVKKTYRWFIENEKGEIVPNKNYPKEKFAGSLQNKMARAGGPLKHFLLPDIPGGSGDLQSIREAYDSRNLYKKSDRHLFMKIGQGEMWAIPRQENPYLLVSMSECSTLVGKTTDKLFVAHISFSLTKQVTETVKFMQAQGVEINNIYAIACTGTYQEQKAQQNHERRATQIQDYLDLGLPPQNITEFSYNLGPDDGLGRFTMKNLTEIIICNDGIFKYSFDLLNDQYAPGAYHQTFVEGSYRDEEIITF